MQPMLFRIRSSFQAGRRLFIFCCPRCGWPVSAGSYFITIVSGNLSWLLAYRRTCQGHTLLAPALFDLHNEAREALTHELAMLHQNGTADELLTIACTKENITKGMVGY